MRDTALWWLRPLLTLSLRGEAPRRSAGCAAWGPVGIEPVVVVRDADDRSLVEVGVWPRLTAQILRARLETAGIDVLAQWSDASGGQGTLVVPAGDVEFARAVVHEIDVDDEVPDTSPIAYVTRIEEHLSAVAELLDELRGRLDELEGRPEAR